MNFDSKVQHAIHVNAMCFFRKQQKRKTIRTEANHSNQCTHDEKKTAATAAAAVAKNGKQCEIHRFFQQN